VAPNGEVFFTDQPNNAIWIWNEKKGIRRFEVDGERANGLYFDAGGQLVACADYRNKLIRIAADGEKTVLAENYGGKHLNGPNDLWIHRMGISPHRQLLPPPLVAGRIQTGTGLARVFCLIRGRLVGFSLTIKCQTASSGLPTEKTFM